MPTSYNKLNEIQTNRRTYLCIGLDTDLEKIPAHFKKKPSSIFEFNKDIIDATSDIITAYKINFAFYEQWGIEGIGALKKTKDYIPEDLFTIADAKRGDIGNTSKAYAKGVFEYFNFDSITVNAYMGKDSVEPFLNYSNKMTFILSLTSNPGSNDFQRIISARRPLFKHIIRKSLKWGSKENIAFVVGATHPDELMGLRQFVPEHYFLIPGIGTQGGDIKATLEANNGGPVVINVSRDILYASNGLDFAEKAREKAVEYRKKLTINARMKSNEKNI